MNSNWSYNPINNTQLGNLDNLNTGTLKASIQDNTDQTTDNGYTIEEQHKSPEQVIIMIITNRWSDHIQENNIKVNSRFIYHSHAILDQEIQNYGDWPEAASPDRERFLQPRWYQKYPHRSWLGNWLWALIVKIQGYCYLRYREYLQKLYSLDRPIWCLTEQTNVLRADTTSYRTRM